MLILLYSVVSRGTLLCFEFLIQHVTDRLRNVMVNGVVQYVIDCVLLGIVYTRSAFEGTVVALLNMASELEQLRQEAEQLKLQIQVSILTDPGYFFYT